MTQEQNITSIDRLNTSGFDSQNPPSSELIDKCIHCGFCLSTCPSYRVLGTEMDSPRGRIHLLDAINKGDGTIDSATTQHFDSCLGCLACVSTCPSDVQYDRLLASTRSQIERNQPRKFPENIFLMLVLFI